MVPRPLSLALPAALLALTGAAGASPAARGSASRMLNRPLTFERNTGRYPKDVQFVARSGQGALSLTSREAVLTLRRAGRTADLRLTLRGSNPKAAASGLDKQPGVVSYFIGKDPAKWRTHIPTFSRVKLAGVYPGVDLVYYGAGKSRTLEYDFVVKPGADPSRIRMAVSGAKSLRTVGGRLVASTSCGDVTLNRPYAYQTVGGVRKQVACSFAPRGNTVAFRIARYDASRPLVVDPTLTYEYYIDSTGEDYAAGVAVDSTGACYTAGALGVGAYGLSDAFAVKVRADGALDYLSFVGGADDDRACGLAVDASGCAYLTGSTYSTDFPVTPGAKFTTFGGGTDAYVVKLGAAGSTIEYGTYLGNDGFDDAWGIGVDAAGNAYVAGNTSANFPVTPGAFQTAGGTSGEGFVSKFNATGSDLVYSTYLAGSDSDLVNGMAVDAAGCVYVTGCTCSSDFPVTPGAFQTTFGGGSNFGDAFLTKLKADGTGLVYSTYIGAAGEDTAYSVSVDAGGYAYVCGTAETGFPTTAGAYQTAFGGSTDAWVAKVDTDGSKLVYCTYIGGAQWDAAYGVSAGPDGTAYVSSYTAGDWPVTPDAYQGAYGGGDSDWAITALNPAGSALTYSTYYGAASYERYPLIAFSGGAAHVAGERSNGSNGDAQLVKFTFTTASTSLAVDSLSATAGARVTLRGRLTDGAGAGIAGQRLQFKVDGGAWVASEVLTSALGYATLTITAPAAGSHPLACKFDAAGSYPAADGTGTLVTTSLLATAARVNAVTAGPGDGVDLAAYLVTPNGTSPGAGIAGKQMEFQLNGGSWTPAAAPTDAVGKATVAATAPAAAGDYTINARFVGDATHAASSGTAKLTVAAKRNVYVYTFNRTVAGGPTKLIAMLYWRQQDGTLTPLRGKSLRFQCPRAAGVDATVATDASGKAAAAVPALASGTYPFTVDFAGDTDYNAGTASGTLTVAGGPNPPD
ncbi:MAG: SBBP repeat-containing protein [Armatimonadetes bacterium]|nr:SBBP repeat-containing protein [Armatimonadota bacterium]